MAVHATGTRQKGKIVVMDRAVYEFYGLQVLFCRFELLLLRVARTFS